MLCGIIFAVHSADFKFCNSTLTSLKQQKEVFLYRFCNNMNLPLSFDSNQNYAICEEKSIRECTRINVYVKNDDSIAVIDEKYI